MGLIVDLMKLENAELKNIERIVTISKTTFDKNLDYLKQVGYIERIGSKKTGYWKVKYEIL